MNMNSKEEDLLHMNLKVIEEDMIDNGKNDCENLSQKCFTIIPALFKKRSHKYKLTNLPPSSSSEDGSLSSSIPELHQTSLQIFPITTTCLVPGSPISPRVKNFNSDMRELAASRADNPYICQQLDRSNSLSSVHNNDEISSMLLTQSLQMPSKESASSLANPIHSGQYSITSGDHEYTANISKNNQVNITQNVQIPFNRPNEFNDNFYRNDEPNLHDKLVRSPPPHFPEKLSQFLCQDNLSMDIDSEEETLTVTKKNI